MIYIDTNIFIYAIEDHRVYGKKCGKIIFDIQDGKISACASVQVLVEIINVLVAMNKELKKQKREALDIKRNIELVISLPITWFDLDFLTIKKASEYQYGINGADYTHAASMEINSVREIISADKDFDKIDFINRIDPLEYGA